MQLSSIEVATLRVRNPAFTFDYDIVPAAIVADRQLNLPLITGTDTLASLGLAQTFTLAQTFSATASFTNASPFSMTNGQVVTVALTAQTVGTATLTIPNFANVSDTFTFNTLAATLVNKTLTAPTINAGALSGIFSGAHTLSGIVTLTAASLAMTAGAAFTLGTTDAQTLIIRTNNTTRWTFAAATSNITAAGAAEIIVPNAANALRFQAGGAYYYTLDSREDTVDTVAHFFNLRASSIAQVAGSNHRNVVISTNGLTLSTTTQVTNLEGLSLYISGQTISQSGGAVTVDVASAVKFYKLTAGASVTITSNRIIDTDVAGCFLTAAGVWTDASNRASKRDVHPVDLSTVPGLLDTVEAVSYRKEAEDNNRIRYGVISNDVPEFLASQDRLGVAAGHLAGFVLAGVKWLREEVKSHATGIQELREEHRELRKRLQEVEEKLLIVGG